MQANVVGMALLARSCADDQGFAGRQDEAGGVEGDGRLTSTEEPKPACEPTSRKARPG